MESTTLLSRCWRIQDGQTQPISTDHRKERESQWIIPTPFSRILQAMKEWIIGWVGIWMGESKTIVFWKVKQWCWLDGVTNQREFVLRPFVCRNRFTKQSLFMDWPRFYHSFDGVSPPMLINEYKWRNGFQRVPVDRWKAGIGIGYDWKGPQMIMKRPNVPLNNELVAKQCVRIVRVDFVINSTLNVSIFKPNAVKMYNNRDGFLTLTDMDTWFANGIVSSGSIEYPSPLDNEF